MNTPLPDVRCKDDYDCGSACLDAIMQHFGVRSSAALALPFVSNPVSGTDPTAAECVLRSAGLGVVSGTMHVDDLKHFCLHGRVIMCPVSMYGGHWVVVMKTTKRAVTFHDPAEGQRTLTPEAFAAVWRDTTRSGHVFDFWGIAAGVGVYHA